MPQGQAPRRPQPKPSGRGPRGGQIVSQVNSDEAGNSETERLFEPSPRSRANGSQTRPANADLFSRPGYPTGLPPGVDPTSMQAPSEEEVSPEEQQQYDQIVRFAANLIYKNPRETLAAMNHGDLPIHQAVGRHAANIAEVIEKTAKASKQTLDPDVFWHAGSEVIEMLMDLGVQAKAFPLDPESEQYQQEAAMALMEAEKIVGEKALKDPKQAARLSAEASDVWAWGIAKEVDAGQASPAYLQMVEQARQANSPVRAGVQAALRRPK